MKLIRKLDTGVSYFEGSHFLDKRGTFTKIFETSNPALNSFSVKQINLVTSLRKNTLRGLHYQKGMFAEAKIFRIIDGIIQLAFIDLRKDSETYTKGDSLILDSPMHSVFIPRGFATGYCTLKNNTSVLYLSDNQYNVQAECGIKWDDPAIALNWKIKNPLLSQKDNSWKKWNP